jgi:hypothetical protein
LDYFSKRNYQYTDIKKLDNSITSYIEIKSDKTSYGSGLMEMDFLDKLKTKLSKVN